jgi:hypothetical protein
MFCTLCTESKKCAEIEKPYIMKKTVKARKHFGAGLDLTIPAEVIKEYEVKAGDIFEVTLENGKEMKLIYKRVYQKK